MTLTPSLNALGAYTSGAKDAAQAAAGVAEFNASLGKSLYIQGPADPISFGDPLPDVG